VSTLPRGCSRECARGGDIKLSDALIPLLDQLPHTVRRLVFDGSFYFPSDDFSRSLNQPLSLARLPATIIEFHSNGSRDTVEGMPQLPSGLQVLSFGPAFAEPLGEFTWPTTLRMLHLGDEFNHPLAGVRFPSSLTSLDLDSSFDHPLAGVHLSPLLTELLMSGINDYSHSLDDVE
jgi:hypothetical protein